MKTLICLILILAIQSAVIKRLSDREYSQLTTEDTILSTLGKFRLYLRPNNCSLRIEKFNYNAAIYEPYEDCVSNNYEGGPCNSLTIKNGKIVTDTGKIYSQLNGTSYGESALILSDEGEVTLQAISINPNNPNSDNEHLTADSVVLKGNPVG